MKKLHIFTILIPLVALTACHSDEELTPEEVVRFRVVIEDTWQNGRTPTRAGDELETIYPNKIFVTATEKFGESPTDTIFVIEKTDSKGHADGYTLYEVAGDFSIPIEDMDNYEYSAKAQWKEPDSYTSAWAEVPAFGDTDYFWADKTITGSVDMSNPPYVTFTLHHQTSFLRVNLGVSQDYLKLRRFKLKSLKLVGDMKTQTVGEGGEEAPSVPYLLDAALPADGEELTSTGKQYFSMHVNPDAYASLADKKFKVTATYDVYDLQGQLTRSDCVASNNLVLKDIFPNAEKNGLGMEKGKYYTINITLAPDFLYVLSDNDNGADLELK